MTDEKKSNQTMGPGFFSSANALSRPDHPTLTHEGPLPSPPPAEPRREISREFSNPGITDYSGNIIGGYKLLEVIGQGGMGQVYLAEHVRLGRRVALKMLRPEYAFDNEAVKRFFGEAKAVNQISHNHIIEITDFIEGKGQPASYIMEFLEGESLAETLFAQTKLEADRLCRIGMQVAAAMAAVHDAFIIHRDLKPDNIFLTTREGRTDFVKLLDFGVAKLTEQSEMAMSEVATTKAGVILGTPEYMAPEQFEAKEIDHRTDIYALGVILYEMATGRKPFQENSIGRLAVATLTKHPTRPLALDNPPEIPYALDALITQCLEKSPDRRPQHMAAIEERLSTILSEMQAGTALYGPLDEDDDLDPRPRPSRAPLWAAGLGVVLLLGGATAYFALGPTSPPPAPPAAEPVAVQAPETPGPETPAPELSKQVPVAVASTPSGATVVLDGAVLGKTPYQGQVPASDSAHTLEVRKSGFKTVSRTFAPGENLVVSLTLPAERGSKKVVKKKRTKPPKKVRETNRKKRPAATAPKSAPPPQKERPARKPRKKKNRKSLLDPFAQ